MKIEKPPIAPVVTSTAPSDKAGAAAGNAPEKTQHQAATTAPAPPVKGVPVTMSKLASNMVQSRQASAADVDQKKVDAVRSAIEKKTFKVNAEAIADKMLANAQEMLQQKSN